MYPDVTRQLIEQRINDLQKVAREAERGRAARKARRARRRGTDVAVPVLPPIPDYVDGTFAADRPTVDRKQSESASHRAA
jgi:hypothetical protein